MLNEQLQSELDQEAKAEAKKLTGRVPVFRMGYEAGHYDAAEKYALKWQEAEQQAERYEKALKDIWTKAKRGIFPHLPVETMGAQVCIEIDQYIAELLTPKQTPDE